MYHYVWKFIEQMEFIKEYIDEECQSSCDQDENKKIFERIKNATTLILNNALCIIRNQYPIIKSKIKPLTVEGSKKLMFQIYQVLQTEDMPEAKEDNIKKIMQEEFGLNPKELLKANRKKSTKKA